MMMNQFRMKIKSSEKHFSQLSHEMHSLLHNKKITRHD